jgi:hypothetical protein
MAAPPAPPTGYGTDAPTWAAVSTIGEETTR